MDALETSCCARRFPFLTFRDLAPRSLSNNQMLHFTQRRAFWTFHFSSLLKLKFQQISFNFIFFIPRERARAHLLPPCFLLHVHLEELQRFKLAMFFLSSPSSHRHNFGKFSPILILLIFFLMLFEILHVTRLHPFLFFCVLGEV